jgi:FMN-dependent NADH-azoreductase
MMQLLPIDSGTLGAASVSSRLSAAARWPERCAEASIVCSGLVSDRIDPFTGDLIAARKLNASPHSTTPWFN